MNWLRDMLFRRQGDIPADIWQRLRRLEVKIDYRFKEPRLLVAALRHRSVLTRDNLGRHESNERLEFLGDAVLDFVIAEYFYHLFPGMVEGQLTKLRSVIVSGTSLVGAAQRMDLGDALILSDNEDRAGGRNRASILEDAFEALIGALYLDGGVKAAARFIETHLLDNWRDVVTKDEYVNYKSLVLEHAQANAWDSPVYKLVEETGPDHSKRFVVEIFLNGESYGRGEGTSKKSAEQRAASVAASRLGLLGSDELNLDSASD